MICNLSHSDLNGVAIAGMTAMVLAGCMALEKIKMEKTKKYERLRELIFWSYANLAMAHTAVERNQEKYGTFNYVIRAKLFKGLKDGTMNMRTIFDDEKIKLQTGQICNYCGSNEKLALDHIFAQKMGGNDDAENLIFACRSCNSSKGKKDLMEWMDYRGEFLPLMIIRRYLKLVFRYCSENSLLEKMVEETMFFLSEKSLSGNWGKQTSSTCYQ